MEEVDKDPEETSEPSVLSENQETKTGVSTQDAEENPSMEVKEDPLEGQPQEEEEEEEEEGESEEFVTPQRMIDLQRDSTALVSNIQTAADIKESMRRTELEEAHRIRFMRLMNDVKSSQEIFEEINRGWSIAQQKVIPQELQEALNSQQQLCAALIEDKKKLINDLRQEMKAGDDCYVKDLRKQAEELDLMMERMDDQIKILTKAYREELDQMQEDYQQECEVSRTRDNTEWEQRMKELWDNELERFEQRRKKVEEYETRVHNLMLETSDKFSLLQAEEISKLQTLEREQQQKKSDNMIARLKIIKQKDENEEHTFNLALMKKGICSLQTEMKDLKAKSSSQAKELTKKSQYLSKDYERNIQQYERIQKKIKRFAVADARKLEDMWLMVEAEVKQLAERVLLIDSLICMHLGLAWERPPMEFMEFSGPVQPQKQALRSTCPAVSQLFPTGQALQYSQRTMDPSVRPRLETDTESTDIEMYKDGTVVQSESGVEVEDGKLSTETLNKVLELLCDEAGFLIEDEVLNLLAPLEKEQQTFVKLGSLLCSFGIEGEDMPKLAAFLLKYKHQQREQTEDVCVESGQSSNNVEEVETKSTTHLTPELINPNHVVPALKSFLEQHMRSRESSARQRSFHVEARDSSEDAAYLESMANIVSEDKMQLWDAAENMLKQYQAILTDISELIPESQSLKQQNAELRMLLQQSLNSRVGADVVN